MNSQSIASNLPGYTYGGPEVGRSSVSVQEFENLKITAGFTQEDEGWLRLAGEVLAGQTARIVEHWRSRIIAGIPHLARHSRATEGDALPGYLTRTNRRFEQWILDTCLRPYNQEWLDYQNEIALRHTSVKKNRTDGVDSTSFVPFRDVLTFIPVMNATLKPYLGARGHSAELVNKMHGAWVKAMQIQMALWAKVYMVQAPGEW